MKQFCYIVFILLIGFSCKKDNFTEDTVDGLRFSVDTLTFDTVFTTIGSATRYFKVYNTVGKDLKIKRIYLSGDNGFRLNINGMAANSQSDVILKKDDSLFIFVEVKVNPQSSNSPMVILDSVMFEFTSNVQKLYLMAFGQNVHLVNGEIISADTLWTNEKPHLVYNSMLVDSNVILTITQGTKIYFHKNSRMFIKGTLKAFGSKDEPVIFQGDRLESWYRDVPGQWDGIYFVSGHPLGLGSRDNELNYCDIKNAIIGIQADSVFSSNPCVKVTNTKILNMNAVGIYGRGTTIQAVNTIISNCGQFAVLIVYGGSYEFYHCTLYNDWSYSNRTTPSLLLNNYYMADNGIMQVRPLEKATFGNCIIYGSKEDEIYIDAYPGSPVFEYKFENCIIKAGSGLNTSDASRFIQIYKNLNPGLKSPAFNNFELDTMSNSMNKGNISIGTTFSSDFNGNSRIADGFPDLGAYERVD